MKAGVLFSGGKDSSLAAIMLSENYEVELNTFVFSPESVIVQIEQAAAALGFPHLKQNLEIFLLIRRLWIGWKEKMISNRW